MLCPNCGSDLGNRQMKFCPNCGKNIPAAAPKPKIDTAEPVSLWEDLQFEKVIHQTRDSVFYRAFNKQTNGYAAVKVITIPSAWEECEKLLSAGMSADALKKHFAQIANSRYTRCCQIRSLNNCKNVVKVDDVQIVKKDQLRWEIQVRTELLTPFRSINFGAEVKEGAIAKLAADLCDGAAALRGLQLGLVGFCLDDIYIDSQHNYKLGVFEDTENTVADEVKFQAPEVLANGYADAKSDVYSIGMIMYYLLNNKQMPQMDLMHPPKNASAQLARVIACACAQNPNARYASAEQLKAAIMDALRGPKTQGNTEKPPVKADKPAKPKKEKEPKTPGKKNSKSLLIAILAAVIVLLLAAGAFFGVRWLRNSDVQMPEFAENILGDDSSSDVNLEDEDLSDEEIMDEKDPGNEVIDQTEAPTAPVEIMPKLVGMKNSDAAQAINSIGCIVTFEYEFNDAVEKDYVIAQSIEKDTAVEAGTNVVLLISQGPNTAPEGYNQKVVVTAASGSSYGTLVFYEWEEGQWISKFSCDATVGKNGISSNYGEGKGRTPEGSYKLGVALSANSIPNSGWPFQQVSSSTCVVDDVNSIYYNTIQNKNNVPSGTSVDPIGDTIVKGYSTVCVYIEHNGNGIDPDGVVAGKGSVITLCGRSGSLKPTAGCVDISSSNMTTLLGLLDYNKNPHIEMYVQ